MLAAVATGALALLVLAGGRGARPDLVETDVNVSPGPVIRGGFVRLSHVVRNAGGAGAAPSITGFYLAAGRTRIRLVGMPVSRLRAHDFDYRATQKRIPADTPLGLYRVMACADDRHRIPESNDRNNCSAATRRIRVVARSADTDPPRFEGLERATTCIPGPIGTGKTSSYRLVWEPARDNVTPTGEIVYDVFQATASRGESFSAPTYTTPPGITEFVTPKLPSEKAYYFVVRARDRAGNRDANRIERLGENLCE